MSSVAQPPEVERISRLALVFLLAADLLLVLVYAAAMLGQAVGGIDVAAIWNLNGRFSLSSNLNYAKYVLAMALLMPLALAHRRTGYAWIAALVGILFLDDILEIHDQLGVWIGGGLAIGPLTAMHPQDRGEPVVYAVLLVIACALLAAARRDLSGSLRRIWLNFAVAIALLAAFGAGVDVVHGLVTALAGDGFLANALNVAFVIVEDGGESLALTGILWLAIDGLLHAAGSGRIGGWTPLAAPALHWIRSVPAVGPSS